MRNFFCIVGTIIGVLVTGLLVVTLYMGLRDATSVTKEPVRLDMRGAVELAKSGRSAWVWLTDATADCARYGRYTYAKDDETWDAVLFVASNAAKDMEVVVDVRDLRECSYAGDAHFIGMLKRLDANERSGMSSRGLTLPASGGPEWWLCASCKPGDEWAVLVIVLLITVFSGWLTVKIYRARHAPVEDKPRRRSKGRR